MYQEFIVSKVKYISMQVLAIFKKSLKKRKNYVRGTSPPLTLAWWYSLIKQEKGTLGS